MTPRWSGAWGGRPLTPIRHISTIGGGVPHLRGPAARSAAQVHVGARATESQKEAA
jgi:hypothetical protein